MQQHDPGVQPPVEFTPAEHTDFIFAVRGDELWAALLALCLVAGAIVIWRRRRRWSDRGDAE